jgi:hypothetical protein
LTLRKKDLFWSEREVIHPEFCATTRADRELLRRILKVRVQAHGTDMAVHFLQFSQKYCRQLMADPCLMKYVAMNPSGYRNPISLVPSL